MWPTLISVGPLAIHSFGVLMALGIFLGGFIFWQRGREEGFDEVALMDGWLAAGLAGLAVGRLWQVLNHWQEYGSSWYRILFITKFPGIANEGMLVGALLILAVKAFRQKWEVWRLMEAGVLAILTVEIFFWLGSFMAGSHLGLTSQWWWALQFPGVEGRRLPVQLLFVFFLWGLFLMLKKWEKEYRSFSWYQQAKGESKPGFILAVYLIGLGLIRLVLGFLLDGNRVRLALLQTQWFGLALVVLGSLLLAERSGINKKGLSFKPKVIKENKLERPERQIKKRKKKGFDFK